MLDDVLDALVDFLQLLLILEMRLFHRRAYRWPLVMGVLERLILGLDGVVCFLEKGKGCIVYAIFSISQAGKLEEVVLEDFSPFFLHVDLLSIPIAKLTVIDPILRLRVTRESQDILTIRTGKAKGALAVFDSALIHPLA